jgi:hypothetical protein
MIPKWLNALEEDNDFMYNIFIQIPKEGTEMIQSWGTKLKSTYRS